MKAKNYRGNSQCASAVRDGVIVRGYLTERQTLEAVAIAKQHGLSDVILRGLQVCGDKELVIGSIQPDSSNPYSDSGRVPDKLNSQV